MSKIITLILLAAAAVWLSHVNVSDGGGVVAFKLGMKIGGGFFIRIIPLILIFSIITGQIQAYYIRKPAQVSEMLRGRSGIMNGAILGATIPGGATAGDAVINEWKKKTNPYAIIAFLISMSLLNWTTLVFRLPFLGGSITLMLIAIGLVTTTISIGILMLVQRLTG